MVSRVLLLAVGAATALGFAAGDASASERYRQRPPVVVSPDLAAPWVMQLEGQGRAVQPLARPPAPRVVRRGWFQAVQPPPPQLRRAYRQQRPAGLPPAGIAAPVPQEVHPPLDPRYLPQDVVYEGSQAPGTIIIDTRENFLYLVKEGGMARRYGVGTGKPGFEWAGTHKVTRKATWPDWRPPSEMIARERAKGRHLPTFLPGGPDNPLGARALYLGSTLYRSHGTNQPWTIGAAVSSGCIRMRNEDVVDLYERVPVGATVVVM